MNLMEMSELTGREPYSIGRRLVVTRLALNEKQPSIFAVSMKWSPQSLANWESGLCSPPFKHMTILKDTHAVTTDWIYFGDPSGLPKHVFDKIEAIVDKTDNPDSWSRQRSRRSVEIPRKKTNRG